MTGNMNQKDDFFSANDALDINELASLNEDISAEFIEQLQSNITQSVSDTLDDSTLFEDIKNNSTTPENTPKFDEDIDDNFIKKYQAKIKKQKLGIAEAQLEEKEKEKEIEAKVDNKTEQDSLPAKDDAKEDDAKEDNSTSINTPDIPVVQEVSTAVNNNVQPSKNNSLEKDKNITDNDIEKLTNGNIIERPLQEDQLKYNESLDYLDENVKYSKYVIYIDPENTNFIESLTVKERKNLINRILREQDDIAITKRRLSLIQTFIKHSIIAIITIAIAIPVVYYTINASLEASINNYRRSQSIFKTLYREKGKIKKTNKSYY